MLFVVFSNFDLTLLTYVSIQNSICFKTAVLCVWPKSKYLYGEMCSGPMDHFVHIEFEALAIK